MHNIRKYIIYFQKEKINPNILQF